MMFRISKCVGVLVFVFIFFFPLKGADIHEAAKAGKLEKVKQILFETPKAVNQKDKAGRTPLHWACRGVHFDVVKYLLDKGADAKVVDNNRTTPLHSIAARGHMQALNLLIEKGADVNAKNYEGFTALHYAGIYGQPAIVRRLLEKDADIEAANARLRTPLLITARENGNIQCARILVEKGANIDAVDKYGDTSLTLAAWRGYKEIVNLLLDHNAKYEAKGEQGRELMIYAAGKGLVRLFSHLVKKGADLKSPLPNNQSLLHVAAIGAPPDMIEQLIQSGLELEKKDAFGWTPLHYAANSGNIGAVKVLMQKKAAPNLRNIAGESPYNLAVKGNLKQVIQYLKENKADTGSQQFPQLKGPYMGQSPPGKTPVRFAPGIVSSVNNLHCPVVFSPDGKTALWPPMFPIPGSGYSRSNIMISEMRDGKWTAPFLAPFADQHGNDAPFFSPDGKGLYFISRRPLTPGGRAGKENIWFTEKTTAGWAEPRPIDPLVNDFDIHWQFSVAANGSLYFGSSQGSGMGENDIWFSRKVKGKLTAPQNLGPAINTSSAEFSPIIAPDESYIIFTRSSELYISFRQKGGAWGKAVNMGEPVNSNAVESCAFVSYDGKYLFFLSRRNGERGVYWMEASVIEELKKNN